VPPRVDVYKAVSQQIREIFAEYTPLIEPLSLDETYLDVTENLKGMEIATEIALEIRAKIKQVTGLNASAGISYNKFLAKMASDLNKPNGQAVITPKNGPGFVEALPVKKFHGVGPATAERMRKYGIETGLESPVLIFMASRGASMSARSGLTASENPSAPRIRSSRISTISTWPKPSSDRWPRKPGGIAGRTTSRERRSPSKSNTRISVRRHAAGPCPEPFPFKRPVRLLGITLSSLNTEESGQEPQLDL